MKNKILKVNQKIKGKETTLNDGRMVKTGRKEDLRNCIQKKKNRQLSL